MKEITLSNGEVTIVDEDVYEWASQNKWTNHHGYASRKRNNKHEKLHRLIMNPKNNQVVDHINGNTLDNRRCNLRICTQKENARNRKPNTNKTVKSKGVDFQKRSETYRARIRVNYVHIYLGDFQTEQEAAEAYRQASEKYHKGFGRV